MLWFTATTKEHWAVGRCKISSKLRASHTLQLKPTRIKRRGRSGRSRRWLLTNFAHTETKLWLKWWKRQWKEKIIKYIVQSDLRRRIQRTKQIHRFKSGQISYWIEKHNRRHPPIEEGDCVRVFDKGKGNYTSRKETRSQWSERKCRVNLKSHDVMNNTFYKLEGLTKRYNRHELLLMQD